MKLQPLPFQMVKSGQKRIELRLYDEKRRDLKVGDSICFTQMQSGERIKVKIKALQVFTDFFALYKSFAPQEMGYRVGKSVNPADMYAYYSKEDIKKYGALAICIE